MSQIKEANVLITGGAQGIGKLLGEKCLKRGAKNLIIWDINEKNIQQTLTDFTQKGFQNVHAFHVDVSNNSDIEKAATEVLLEIGNVDILINSAGIIIGKMFWEHTADEIERTIQINTNGALLTTRVFVNEMIRQGRGHIINIASASSLISNRKMSVYLASKWAVYGWSDSLRLELESLKKDLHVTTVCPGYINTGMFKGVKAPFLVPLLEPEDITDKIIRAIEKNKIFLLDPLFLNFISAFRGILPTRIFDMAAELMGVYNSMEDFQGRKKEEAVPNKKTKQTY